MSEREKIGKKGKREKTWLVEWVLPGQTGRAYLVLFVSEDVSCLFLFVCEERPGTVHSNMFKQLCLCVFFYDTTH